MDKLEELTEGSSINQLYHQLAHQLNNGEPIRGSICSHIVSTLIQRHIDTTTKCYWRSVRHTPPSNTEVLLYYGKGLIVSGRYTTDKFVQYGNMQINVSGLMTPTHWSKLDTLTMVN